MPLLDSVDGEVIRRIMRRITVDDNECWLFEGMPSGAGHGQISYHNRTIGTHILMYVYHYGPVSEGLMVLHKCDVPNCCNPEHLETGTRSKNAIDAVRRGKSRVAKLTMEDAREIRLMVTCGAKYWEMQGMFGVSYKTITSIISGRTWKEFDEIN
jgi:hypothetical protein